MKHINQEYVTLPDPAVDSEAITVTNTTNCVHVVQSHLRGVFIEAPDGREACEVEVTWEGWKAVFKVKNGKWHVSGDFFMADKEPTPIVRTSGRHQWTGASGKGYGKGEGAK